MPDATENRQLTDRQTAVETQILLGAVKCFENDGIRGTTINSIAAQAGVSRRTVYRYYATKELILKAAFEKNSFDLAQQLVKSVDPDLSFPDFVVEVIVFMIEHAPHSPLFKVNIIEEIGAGSLYYYFSSKKAVTTWIELFQPAYIRALREETVDPEFDLPEIVEWAGRISNSFLQNPRTMHRDTPIVRDSIQRLVGKALRRI